MNTTLKNILWAIVSVIVAVIISVFFTDSRISQQAQSFSSVVNRATTYLYLQATQALGLGGNTGGFYNTNNTVNLAATRQNINAASTTICALQNPFAATSTIQSIALNITTATGTAVSWVFATSTAQFATTSLIVSNNAVSGALSTITWDPGSNNSGIPGNAYVVVGANGISGAGSTGIGAPFAGTCSAVFNTI